MGMIILIIALAAGMLWLGFMGREKTKAGGSDAGENPILPVFIAPIAGLIAFMGAGSLGGELWGMLAAAAVFFGVLYYCLAMMILRVNRVSQKRIQQLEQKIDQLAELLVEEAGNEEM